jgi:hypothetical protein
MDAGATSDGSSTPDATPPDSAAPDATVTLSSFNTTADHCGTADGTKLLEIGHAAELTAVRANAERVLSLDSAGQWALWDRTTRARLAVGTAPLSSTGYSSGAFVELRADTFVVGNSSTVEVRRAVDGSLRATITTQAEQGGLALDGSYAWTRQNSGADLTAWSLDGAMLVQVADSTPGAFARPHVAAPAALLLPTSSSSGNFVRRIPVDGTASTDSSTYVGSFVRWFEDGQHFITTAGGSSIVYTADAVREPALPAGVNPSGARGKYVWLLETDSGVPGLGVYEIGGSARVAFVPGPAAAPQVVDALQVTSGHGSSLYLWRTSSTEVKRVDLSGAAPVVTTLNAPGVIATDEGYARAYGALLYTAGLAKDAAEVPYNCGGPIAAGSATDRLAVATEDGWVRIFDPDGAGYHRTAAIPIATRRFALSADGTRLLAVIDTSIRAYRVPEGEMLTEWTTPSDLRLDAVSFAASGDVFSVKTCLKNWFAGFPPCTNTVHRFADGAVALETKASSEGEAYGGDPTGAGTFAPNGKRIALLTVTKSATTRNATIWEGASVLGETTDAYPLFWATDDQLVVTRWRVISGGALFFDGGAVVDTQGRVLRSLSVPSVLPNSYRVLDAASVYSVQQNAVISLADGALLWSWSTPQLFPQVPGSKQPQGLGAGRDVILATFQGQVLYRRWR